MDVFTADPFDARTADERSQLEAFLDNHRRALNESLEGLTEEEARRRLVPSRTTLLGLVKHAAYVEGVMLGEAVMGVSGEEAGLPSQAPDSFALDDGDTIARVREAHRQACVASVRACSELALDDVVTGRRLGQISIRWIYLHLIREMAEHCGHADILREQVLDGRTGLGTR